MEKLYFDVELPLCRVLADMERSGFLVDGGALARFGADLSDTIDRLENATQRSMKAWLDLPFLGGHPLPDDAPAAQPQHAAPQPLGKPVARHFGHVWRQ